MVGLVSALVGEIAYEAVRFIIMYVTGNMVVFVVVSSERKMMQEGKLRWMRSENKEKEITE